MIWLVGVVALLHAIQQRRRQLKSAQQEMGRFTQRARSAKERE